MARTACLPVFPPHISLFEDNNPSQNFLKWTKKGLSALSSPIERELVPLEFRPEEPNETPAFIFFSADGTYVISIS